MPESYAMLRRAEEDPEIVVAWTTALECVSALREAGRLRRIHCAGLLAMLTATPGRNAPRGSRPRPRDRQADGWPP